MQRHPLVTSAIVSVVLLGSVCAVATCLLLTSGATHASLRNPNVRVLPLSFEPNVGQAERETKFLARTHDYNVQLLSDRIRLTPLDSDARNEKQVDLVLSSRATNRIEGVDSSELPGKVNYLTGNDSSKWMTNVRTYGQVAYPELEPGISVVCHGSVQRLEIDWVVAAGSDPHGIEFELAGNEQVSLDEVGELLLGEGPRKLRVEKPEVYQLAHNQRQSIPGRFVSKGGRRFGFEVGPYDPTRDLVIDPELVYSAILGGSSDQFGWGVAVDPSGNFYMTGDAESSLLPTEIPLVNALQGWDGPCCRKPPYDFYEYLTKFAAGGASLVYSTYLGGSSQRYGTAVAADAEGNAYVVANNRTGLSEIFIQKISPTGSASLYSTYISGNGPNTVAAIAVDSAGDAYITGQTSSTNFPLVNAFQSVCSGCSSGYTRAYVSKLNATGSGYVYSTYLGGTRLASGDGGKGIAVDSQGNAYVTGETVDIDFPVVSAFQPQCKASCGEPSYVTPDAFLTKFGPTGSVIYSTYLGGSSNDVGTSVAVDSSGDAYVTGWTGSTDFPVKTPVFGHSGSAGSADAFITKFSASGAALSYSTYVGGTSSDQGNGIAVDAAGNAFIVGSTQSSNFPVKNPLQSGLLAGQDPFVCELDAAGTAFTYCTYFGSQGTDLSLGEAIAVDSSDTVYISGPGSGSSFPTTSNAYQSGNGIGFITKISSP
jgi:hypothetical protein